MEKVEPLLEERLAAACPPLNLRFPGFSLFWGNFYLVEIPRQAARRYKGPSYPRQTQAVLVADEADSALVQDGAASLIKYR
jgi:hypothetical protein